MDVDTRPPTAKTRALLEWLRADAGEASAGGVVRPHLDG